MSKKWLCSDHHFGHANIIKHCDRPFNDVNHMDNELIERHNSLVAPNDLVYHLGDFCFDTPEVCMFYLERLNGKFIFIRGNHDYSLKGKKGEKILYNWIVTGKQKSPR